MDTYLLASPFGFGAACRAINASTAADLQAAARAELSRLSAGDADASHGGSASSVAAGLGHIYRGAQQTGTDAAALKAALSKHTDLLPAAVESITSVYSSVHGSTASTAVALAPPTRPQLVGVEWAVGANLASSSVAATAPPAPLPFVSMQLRIRHPDGSFGRESVEMSVPQLRLFESALKEAVAALDKA